jgi:catechol 2,3-dioxygenase-like lactoylglutathione lyase family enzyme
MENAGERMERELSAVIDAMGEGLTTVTREEDRAVAKRYLAALASALASAMRSEDVAPHVEGLERLFGQTVLLDRAPFLKAFAHWDEVKRLVGTPAPGAAPAAPAGPVLGDASLIAFLATNQPERAREFYAGTLGLRLVSEDEFAIVFEAGGAPLRVQKVTQLLTHAFTALGWQVRDLSGVVSGLLARGVVFERYPFLEQDEAGIWRAPGGASVAWFKDPDGNLLSLTQSPAP